VVELCRDSPDPSRRIEPSNKLIEGSMPISVPSQNRASSPRPVSLTELVSATNDIESALTLEPQHREPQDKEAARPQRSTEPVSDRLGAVESEQEPSRKRRKITAAAAREDTTLSVERGVTHEVNDPEEADINHTTLSKKKTKTKKKANNNAEVLEEGIVADAFEGAKTKRKRRHKRPRTPENAEEIEIVPSAVKMSDLCKDSHTGKKSKREAELQSMNWAEIARKKKERKERAEATESTPQQNAEMPQETETAEQPAERTSATAPQMRIVNGEIVLDTSSLQVDRHVELIAQTADMEEIEENPLTRKVNSASWLKKSKAVSWDEDNTALFYKGLRMFGTDFQMISRLFPGRSRRSIKLKFVNEERKDAQKIKQTLLGPKEEADLAEISLMTNTIYEDPSALDKDLSEDRKRIEMQHARDKEAHDEMIREAEIEMEKAKEAATAELSAKENEVEGAINPAEGVSAKKTRKSGVKKKRSQAKTADVGEVEILGTIEHDDPRGDRISEKAADHSTVRDGTSEAHGVRTRTSRGKGTRQLSIATKTGGARGRKAAGS
jgi:transcription factor TFIIIB component B''